MSIARPKIHWYYTPEAERQAINVKNYRDMTEAIRDLEVYINKVIKQSGIEGLAFKTFCKSNAGTALDIAEVGGRVPLLYNFTLSYLDSDDWLFQKYKTNADFFVLLFGRNERMGAAAYNRAAVAPLFPFHQAMHALGHLMGLTKHNAFITHAGQFPNIMTEIEQRIDMNPDHMFFTNPGVTQTWDGVEVRLGDDADDPDARDEYDNPYRSNDFLDVSNGRFEFETRADESDECVELCPGGQKRWVGNSDPLPTAACHACDNTNGVVSWGTECTILKCGELCDEGLKLLPNGTSMCWGCPDPYPTFEPTDEPTVEPTPDDPKPVDPPSTDGETDGGLTDVVPTSSQDITKAGGEEEEEVEGVPRVITKSQLAVASLSVVARGQSFAGSQRLLWLMKDCDDAALDDEPRWDMAPIPLAIPRTAGTSAYYTGGAVMAVVLLSGVIATHIAIALIYYCIVSVWLSRQRQKTKKETPSETQESDGTRAKTEKKTNRNKKRIKYMSLPKALHDCKVTYSAIAMYAIVAEPIGLLATATLTADFSDGAVGWDQRGIALAILVVFIASGSISAYLVLGRHFSRAVRLEPVSAEEKMTKSAFLRPFIPESLWVVAKPESVKKKTEETTAPVTYGEVETDATTTTGSVPAAAAAQDCRPRRGDDVLGKEVALLKYKDICSLGSAHGKVDADAAGARKKYDASVAAISTLVDFDLLENVDDEVSHEPRTQQVSPGSACPQLDEHLWYVCKGAPVYMDFSCRGWYVIEVTISFLLGVTEALTPLFGCNPAVGTGFALLLIHTIFMCKLRPYLIPCDRYLMMITSPLMTIVAALKLIFVVQKTETIADVMEFGLVGIGLLLLRSLLDAFAFVRNLFLHVCFGWTRYRTATEVKLEKSSFENAKDDQEPVVPADSLSPDRVSPVVSRSDLERPHQPPPAVGTIGYTESDIELLGLGRGRINKLVPVEGSGTREDVSGHSTEGRSARSFVDAFEAPKTREEGKGSPLMLLSRQHQQKAILNFLDQQHKRNGTGRGKDGDGNVALSVIPTAENAGVGTKSTSVIEVTADARAVQNAIETMKLTAKGSAPGPSTPVGALAKRDVAIDPTATHVNPAIPVAAVANRDSRSPQNCPSENVAGVNDTDAYAIL